MEYDFSDVPNEEVEACELYEYARESAAFIDSVNSIRLQKKERKDKTRFSPRYPCRAKKYNQKILIAAFAFLPSFPAKSWKSLSPKAKEIVSEQLKISERLERFRDFPVLISVNHPTNTTLQEWNEQVKTLRGFSSATQGIKSGFFAVNMKYPIDVLVDEFIAYLKMLSGENPNDVSIEKHTPKPVGRKSSRDALNALGIMRLRIQCGTFAQAKQFFKPNPEKGAGGFYYTSRESANRACKSALKNFKELFGWIDPKEPINFSDRWMGIQ